MRAMPKANASLVWKLKIRGWGVSSAGWTELKSRGSLHTKCGGPGLQSQPLGRLNQEDWVQDEIGEAVHPDCKYRTFGSSTQNRNR